MVHWKSISLIDQILELDPFFPVNLHMSRVFLQWASIEMNALVAHIWDQETGIAY